MGIISTAYHCFMLREIGEGESSRLIASENQPPPADASPELVASCDRLMSELHALRQAELEKTQREADAVEAAFQQAHAEAQAARVNAYRADIAAQLRLIDELFREIK